MALPKLSIADCPVTCGDEGTTAVAELTAALDVPSTEDVTFRVRNKDMRDPKTGVLNAVYAEPGVHFEALDLPCTIPAGQMSTKIAVTCKSTAETRMKVAEFEAYDRVGADEGRHPTGAVVISVAPRHIHSR